MKVIALGRTEMLYESISKIKEGGHDIPLIITCGASPGYKILPADFERLAGIIGADFLLTERINDPEIIEKIKACGPDIAISVNWKNIIGQQVINCFPLGIINAHAGDLPRYRGNAVPNWAIINGEDKVVLTVHLMAPELDAGPVVLKRPMAIAESTYISEVYDFMKKIFRKCFWKPLTAWPTVP